MELSFGALSSSNRMFNNCTVLDSAVKEQTNSLSTFL
jgi:hypothetical protein